MFEQLEERVLLSATPYHLTFDDEFNALQLATGPGTDGWLPRDYWNNAYLSGNGEQQYYVNPLTENHNPFSIDNGILTIRAEPTPAGFDADGQPYVSGEITTAKGYPHPANPQGNGFSQTYGYYEVRAKLPAGKGLWPAFWLLRSNGSWPPEYDIFEVLGHDTDSIHQTSHWNNTSGQHVSQGYNYAGIVDSADGFHTYGFEWDADNIRWYVDGNLTQTQANRVNSPMYMLLNMTVGGYWPGNPDATTPWPADMEVDYVRVYSADPNVAEVTPQSGYSVSPHLPINVGQVQQQPNVVRATDDTYIRDGSYAGDNYSYDGRLMIKNHGAANSGYNREGYLKFDLSGQSSIADAKLRLYLNPRAGTNTVNLGVFAAAGTTWSESSLTWSNKPATSGSALDTVSVTNSKNGQWVEWDVTGYLQQEKAAGRDTVTLVLKSLTADNGDVFLFTADEGSVVTAPELVITPAASAVTLGAVADAHVQSGAYANNKYGTSSQLIVKNSGDPNSNWNRESYLKFDLSSVSDVGSGTLRLYLPVGVGTESTTISLYGVSNTSWSESSITWNTKPAASTGVLASTTVTNGSTSAWYEWDISSYLQQEKAAGRNLVTLLLKAEGVTAQYYAFSSEEASGASFDPQLVIDPAAAAPAETELAAAADAYVRDGSYANTNYGGDGLLFVKNYGSPNSSLNREAYLKFDLSSVSSISGGILRLNSYGTTSTGSADIGIYAAADTAWNETAITWNNKPATSGGALAVTNVTLSTTGGWYEWDVTGYLQQEKAAGRNLVTLVIKSITVTNPAFAFSAEEATGDTLDPRLVITSSGSSSAQSSGFAALGTEEPASEPVKTSKGNGSLKHTKQDEALLAYYSTQLASAQQGDAEEEEAL